MLHLYLVRFNECDWDQYDGFVVAAESEDAAIQFLRDHRYRAFEGAALKPLEIAWNGGYRIERIVPKEPAIILDSFRAG